MYDPVAQRPVDPHENSIRHQIEDLKRQLPKKEARRRKLPVFPTYEEYVRFMIALKKRKVKKEYLVALVLSYEAGMRISEIVGFKKKDGTWKVPPLTPDKVDLQRHTIRIDSGKGSKDRIVPLPKNFTERALRLLPLNERISRRALQWFTDKYSKEILGKKLSFHKFRHGFGSRLANQNVPVHQIQMWMGHSRLDTTGIYLHASPSQDAVERVRDLF